MINAINPDIQYAAVQAKAPSLPQDNQRENFSFQAELKKQINSAKKDVKPERVRPKAKGDEAPDKAADETSMQQTTDATPVDTPEQIIAAVVPAFLFAGQPEVLQNSDINQPEVPNQTIGPIVSAALPEILPAAVTPASMAGIPVITQAPVLQANVKPAEHTVPAAVLPKESITENIPAQVSTAFTQSDNSQGKAGEEKNSGLQNSMSYKAVPLENVAQEAGTKKVSTPAEQIGLFSEKLQTSSLGLTANEISQNPVTTTEVKPFEQVASGVLNSYADGKMEFTMKLKPEMLGELTVKMVMSEGKLSMNILTNSAHTSKLIEGQISELRASLKEHNVEMNTCTVENQSFNNLASSNNMFQSGDNRNNQPYDTRRIIITQPVANDASTETLTNRLQVGRMMAGQSILNCYV